MKNPWPAALILFFAALITALVAFAIWSGKHGDALVSKAYYEEELQYQTHIDAVNRTHAEAVAPQVALDEKSRALVIVFSPRAAPLTGEIRLYKPSQSSMDKHVMIVCESNNQFRFSAHDLAPGLWRMKINWTASGKSYFHEQAMVIP